MTASNNEYGDNFLLNLHYGFIQVDLEKVKKIIEEIDINKTYSVEDPDSYDKAPKIGVIAYELLKCATHEAKKFLIDKIDFRIKEFLDISNGYYVVPVYEEVSFRTFFNRLNKEDVKKIKEAIVDAGYCSEPLVKYGEKYHKRPKRLPFEYRKVIDNALFKKHLKLLRSGKPEKAIDFLEKFEINPNLPVWMELLTPAHLAIANPKLFKKLVLEKGAAPNVRDLEGCTPLMFYAKASTLPERFIPINYEPKTKKEVKEIFETAKECGADLNARDNLGRNIVFHGVHNPLVLDYLLEHNFQIDTGDRMTSPMDYAAINRNFEACYKLWKHGIPLSDIEHESDRKRVQEYIETQEKESLNTKADQTLTVNSFLDPKISGLLQYYMLADEAIDKWERYLKNLSEKEKEELIQEYKELAAVEFGDSKEDNYALFAHLLYNLDLEENPADQTLFLKHFPALKELKLEPKYTSNKELHEIFVEDVSVESLFEDLGIDITKPLTLKQKKQRKKTKSR